MKRTTSIIPKGWVAPYRKPVKVNDAPNGDGVGIWDAIDRDEKPNRQYRRLQLRFLDRTLRIRLFGKGQWRKRVVYGGTLRRPEAGDGPGYNGKLGHS